MKIRAEWLVTRVLEGSSLLQRCAGNHRVEYKRDLSDLGWGEKGGGESSKPLKSIHKAQKSSKGFLHSLRSLGLAPGCVYRRILNTLGKWNLMNWFSPSEILLTDENASRLCCSPFARRTESLHRSPIRTEHRKDIFLVATKRLYMSVCPSVRWSVGWSVGP